jgi:hypothetical protein
MVNQLFALDYFAGGVPAGPMLSLHLDELKSLAQQQGKTPHGRNLILELAFIGLFSYFEAFCKDHFASIINIAPVLAQRLKAHGHDINIDTTDLLNLGAHISARVGFLLAEKYEFGTPRKINALYHALLQVSLFSTSEAKKFDKLLADRNLIVHHGGVYTMKYTQQWSQGTDKALFLDSLVIDSATFGKTLGLIEGIGKKTVESTHLVLINCLRNYMKLWIRNGRERSGIYNTGSHLSQLLVRSQ